MNQNIHMKKILIWLTPAMLLFACNNKTEDKKLEISGVITNSPAKKIYLEEIPMTTMQRTVVDSAELSKDGKYKLKTGTGESRVYNLRLDQNDYPLAAVINDVSSITVNARFGKDNAQFPESYEVKGSPVSLEMKDYMTRFNNQLQLIIADSRKYDSLAGAGATDSTLQGIRTHASTISDEIRTQTLDAIKKSGNAALTMFVLGYYQSTSNYPGSGLKGLTNEEVTAIVGEATKKFPDHQGVLTIHSTLNGTAKGWIGQQAPEISLPDPNGKTVRLSSFRGKYVLVDFWASWCRPCRAENPNVVKAYNDFKDKNFTILGVSLDQPGQKSAWQKAIMDDHLTWTHISDLKFWSSEVVPLYKIEGIPYNVLVDPEGKIIAESLRGEDLHRKLSEVLN